MLQEYTTQQETVDKLLSIRHDLETVFHARLTLHDHIGTFQLPDGTKLLPAVNIHQSPCCAFWYGSRDRCTDHCRFAAAQKAAEEKKAFVSTCFCGVTELVMPLYSGKVHAATIFAGMYRQKDFDPSPFPCATDGFTAKCPCGKKIICSIWKHC